jgi:hypothetical protein
MLQATKEWIASSLQRKIALQFCRELPCANASRFSQAMTIERLLKQLRKPPPHYGYQILETGGPLTRNSTTAV